LKKFKINGSKMKVGEIKRLDEDHLVEKTAGGELVIYEISSDETLTFVPYHIVKMLSKFTTTTDTTINLKVEETPTRIWR